jgi:tRNA A-37 threonylcarbamoyl transferase component Bud32
MALKDAHGEPQTSRAVKPAPAWLGRRVGRFKLVASLGQGAMGRVYRAEDVTLQRQVALKILPLKIKFGSKTIGLEQFVREARSAAAIEHPGVVQIYEVNQNVDVFYIAMELLEGGNLSSMVKANGPLDVLRACQLGAEAAEALGHAHRLGIVHRDVKPANLMLSRSGRCKLTDFGLARIDDPNDSYFLGTEAVGTPLYMAPEIARGEPAIGASDIYSLAATMCFLLCGRPPYQGRTAKEVLDQHVSAPLPDMHKWRPDLPQGLIDTICKGLAKRPKDRFSSADLFASALRVHTIPVGASGSVPLSGSGFGAGATMAIQPAQRSRGLLIGIGIGATLLVALGVTYLFWPAAPADHAAVLPPANPPIYTVATPPSTPPAMIPPAGTLLSTDQAALMDIANNPKNPLSGKPVTVVGIPKKPHVTSSGNVRFPFAGTDEDAGFQIFCPASVLSGMQGRFGGTNGANIVGKKVAVEGVISLQKGRLEIRIDSAKQVSIVK